LSDQRSIGQQSPGERPIHADVRLSRRTCGGYLPTDHGLPGDRRQLRLNRVSLCAIIGAAMDRQFGDAGGLVPVLPESVGGDVNVPLVHIPIRLDPFHHFHPCSIKTISGWNTDGTDETDQDGSDSIFNFNVLFLFCSDYRDLSMRSTTKVD
jgi:hypothetical protein